MLKQRSPAKYDNSYKRSILYFKRKLMCREMRLSNKNNYGGPASSMIK